MLLLDVWPPTQDVSHLGLFASKITYDRYLFIITVFILILLQPAVLF